MTTYKVTLELKDNADQYGDPLTFERYLIDVITPALDALGVTLNYSTVTKKRG